MQYGGFFYDPLFKSIQAKQKAAVDAYPLLEFLTERMLRLEELSLDELVQLQDDFILFQKHVAKACNMTPYSAIQPQDAHNIEVHLRGARTQFWKARIPDCALYHKKIPQGGVFAKDELVLGYACGNFKVSFEVFAMFMRQWHTPEKYSTDEAFYTKLDRECCSDWSKMDEFGDSFGGFYRYPEGSYERENAYDLSRKTNLKKLCALPYPRRAVLYAIDLTCHQRSESVRMTVNLCEFIARMRALLKNTWRPVGECCTHVQGAVYTFLCIFRAIFPKDIQRSIAKRIIYDITPCMTCIDEMEF